MYFCRNCHFDFDVLKRKPMIIPCGHTFCNKCINEEFQTHRKYDCKNCPFSFFEIDSIFQNLILTDLNSQRQSVSGNIHPNGRTSSPFFSTIKPEQQSTFAQIQFQRMQSNLDKSSMIIEGQSTNLVEDGFQKMNFNYEPRIPNDNLKRCANHKCANSTDHDFCSENCANFVRGNNRMFSGRHFEGSTKKKDTGEMGTLLSLQRCVTPTKIRSFDLLSCTKKFSDMKNSSTVQKPKFSAIAFTNSGDSTGRCARSGCYNTRHKGFGEGFLYCSGNCHRFVEGKEWVQEKS